MDFRAPWFSLKWNPTDNGGFFNKRYNRYG